MERAAFLARLRSRLEGIDERPELPATFPATPASGRDASPDTFLAALRAVGGTGEVVERPALGAAIERAVTVAVASHGTRGTAVIAPDVAAFEPDIDGALGRAGVEPRRPTSGSRWRADAARADLGITSAVIGVASTGSVLIASGQDSPRAASILPEHHLVILPADRLVPGLDEAIETAAALTAICSNPFLVTGPSRTSDIEMEMVLGAHGPRSVHVLLVR